MLLLYIILGLMPSLVLTMITNIADSGDDNYCPSNKNGCKFKWNIKRQQTMMYYDGVLGHPVVWRNDSFYYRTECDTDDNIVLLSPSELAKVHTADGGYKYLTTVNGQFPGPSLVVHEGQEIEIQVTNQLFQESTGIHWHGMKQLNTNWMDGVPGTTQCPINPQETFTYRFIASPAGTHWYHSHMGLQRNDGLYGALIVLPDPHKPVECELNNPSFDKEFIMIVSDLDPLTANLLQTSNIADVKDYMYDHYDDTGYCRKTRFNTALFNGKGYHFEENGEPTVDVPLETYVVEQNNYYRFRVINAAAHYHFKISVDQHSLVMIASDGMDIDPIVADSFHIDMGERFDFSIYTNQTIQNYYIRAETVERKRDPFLTLAILRYEGADEMTQPTTTPTCVGNGCIMVNCPFKDFVNGENVGTTCINFDTITSACPNQIDLTGDIVEEMIAFDKSETPYNDEFNTVNGIMYQSPSTPPTTIGTAMYDHDCREMPECADNPCECTNQIDLPLGRMIQIVILSNRSEAHPIHLHGYSFAVLKIGYPPEGHNPKNFKPLLMNQDVDCNNYLCNKPFWRNSSWENGNVPGMNTINPPIKDTITMPSAGYVVLRFFSDNPGWWLMHCHKEAHFAEGMGVLLQIGKDEEMSQTPQGFNTCGTFKMSHQEFNFARQNTEKTVSRCKRGYNKM